MELSFDESKFTLADMEDFEAYTGIPLDRAFGPDEKPLNTKVIVALIWIIKRQSEPSITIQQVRALKLTELDLSGLNPTPAAPKGKRARAAS